jgi:hypothetical protein
VVLSDGKKDSMVKSVVVGLSQPGGPKRRLRESRAAQRLLRNQVRKSGDVYLCSLDAKSVRRRNTGGIMCENKGIGR